MESREEFDRDAAREALASIDKARDDVAERARAPRGFYTYLAVGAALLTVSFAVGTWWRLLLVLVGAGIVFSSIRWYRNSTGVWDFGNPFVREAWRYWLMIVPFALALVATAIIRDVVVSVVLGGLIVVLWSVVGPQWDRDYRRALQEPR
ncbi:hypothetical protein D9V41_15205 [Aeromicrobium phragmitis]|uniref:Uncharacterized protein n=1 Tax=Aeromicrobium phragmitis TaxID=2478914 RepID=A0A3L8PKT0_9ACTN|nr:hypothetical protein [Aeromicrobium phragmitis]RLV54662.1 hypothetical protein D9V41_15205 [Aeromicrobium phragmitis]